MAIYNREDPRTALPQLEKDLNSKIESVSDRVDDVSDTINNGLLFSSEETVIGAWVDGKPLYRKVYVYTGSWSANATGTFSVSDLNMDECVTLRGYMSSSSYKHIGFDFYNSSYDYIYLDASNIVHWKVGWASTKNVVIVEYTKTTD